MCLKNKLPLLLHSRSQLRSATHNKLVTHVIHHMSQVCIEKEPITQIHKMPTSNPISNIESRPWRECTKRKLEPAYNYCHACN